MTDRDGRHGAGTDARSVPDLVLERSRLGELPPRERDALARRLEAEPEVRERIAALERSDEEVRRRLEAAGLAGRVHARLATPRERATARSWSLAWPLPAGLAVAATVLLALSLRTSVSAPPPAAPSTATATPSPDASIPPAPRPPSVGRALPAVPGSTSPSGEPGVRLKGLGPALSLFRKTAQGSEALADGDVAHEGDVIRIGYRAFGRRYGVIVSLDGRGAVTRHFPERGAAAAALEPSEVVLLAHAYRLDDAPAWERFFFVTADAPFDVATVEDAARQAAGRTAPASLPLPGALGQTAFLLTKE